MSATLQITIKCDHPGCTATLSVEGTLSEDSRSIPQIAFDVPEPWQNRVPMYGQFTQHFCPEHYRK